MCLPRARDICVEGISSSFFRLSVCIRVCIFFGGAEKKKKELFLRLLNAPNYVSSQSVATYAHHVIIQMMFYCHNNVHCTQFPVMYHVLEWSIWSSVHVPWEAPYIRASMWWLHMKFFCFSTRKYFTYFFFRAIYQNTETANNWKSLWILLFNSGAFPYIYICFLEKLFFFVRFNGYCTIKTKLQYSLINFSKYKKKCYIYICCMLLLRAFSKSIFLTRLITHIAFNVYIRAWWTNKFIPLMMMPRSRSIFR